MTTTNETFVTQYQKGILKPRQPLEIMFKILLADDFKII